MNLTNSVALITGGSAGIGRAIAKSLSEAGARVAINGRNKTKLEETAARLGVFPIQADFALEPDVLRTYREGMEKFGDLDILVNNAGIGTFHDLVQTETAAFERMFATNVTGIIIPMWHP